MPKAPEGTLAADRAGPIKMGSAGLATWEAGSDDNPTLDELKLRAQPPRHSELPSSDFVAFHRFLLVLLLASASSLVPSNATLPNHPSVVNRDGGHGPRGPEAGRCQHLEMRHQGRAAPDGEAHHGVLVYVMRK